MGMKLLSHLMKLLHLMTICMPSQQFCLCGTLFNIHDTLIKHALRLTLYSPLLVVRAHMLKNSALFVWITFHSSSISTTSKASYYSYNKILVWSPAFSYQHVPICLKYCWHHSMEKKMKYLSASQHLHFFRHPYSDSGSVRTNIWTFPTWFWLMMPTLPFLIASSHI